MFIFSVVGQYPFHAVLIAKRNTENPPLPDKAFCGASIIAPQLLLTAAHCIVDNKRRIPKPHWLERLSVSTRGYVRMEQQAATFNVSSSGRF